ncbi:MAG: hypothetical protein C4B59_04715 [Candidatus Methanogaster sp.]|uniref:Uncharacterized protein n=1 Tax=Candidatus Methanogaster sp. TaxID=3386292 RepID=A0AC61L4A1_9EURY|nr:MAG: hypothetical protein C4B59_04715 [ANME-2 cluster archaeon]
MAADDTGAMLSDGVTCVDWGCWTVRATSSLGCAGRWFAWRWFSVPALHDGSGRGVDPASGIAPGSDADVCG